MSRRPWRVALAVIVAAPFLLLFAALPPGRVLSASDGLLDAYLLAEARPDGYRRANELLTDPYRQFVPWRSLTSAELRAGRIPFWNPYAYAGSPLLGNAQSGVFDPLALPYLFASHTSRATVWVAILRLLVAGAGALLLARRMGASPVGSAFAGLVYSWGGFTVTWLLSPHTSSSAWLPWALLAADRVVTTPTAAAAGVLALTLALAVFGGHVEVAFFSAAAAGGFTLLRILQREPPSRASAGRVVAVVALAGALSAALAAVQVLPFLEAIEQGVVTSARASHADAATLVADAHPERLVTQVFPFLQGRPLRGEVNFWTPSTAFHGQVATYASVLGCVLAIFAWAGSPRRTAAWAIGAVGLLAWAYNAGIPPLRWLGSQTPVLRLAAAERVAPVALCALAVLADLGLDRLQRERASGRWPRLAERACLAAGILAVLLGLGLIVEGARFGAAARTALESPTGRAVLGRQADRVLGGLEGAAAPFGLRFLIPWGVIAVSSAFAVRYLRCGRSTRAPIVAALVGAVDLFYLGVGFNPAVPVEHDFPTTAAVSAVGAAAEGGRALMIDEGLPANAATYYRIHDVLGYDAIDRWRLRRLLEAAQPFGRISAFPHADSWVHDLLAVRVVTRHQAAVAGDLILEGLAGDGFRFRNPGAFPLAFVPSDVIVASGPEEAEVALRTAGFDPARTAVVESPVAVDAAVLAAPARVSRPDPARLRIGLEVAEPGLVVVSEGYDPGWTALVDGAPTPVRPAYLALMAVTVPAGHHEIELRFRPRTWPAALALSSMGLLVVALLIIADVQAARRRSALPSSRSLALGDGE